MNQRTYVLISGVIFSGVAVGHLLRLINHFEVVIGPWTIPLWVSWVGLIVAGGLSVWAFRLGGVSKK